MASTEDLAPETSSGTTRRTVLKAAGHAAWMIPAVQIASQVPAMAAASDVLTISSQGTKSVSGSTTLALSNVVAHNSSPSRSTAALTATVTVTLGSASNKNNPTATTPAGWTKTSGPTYASKAVTVTFTANSQPAHGANAATFATSIAWSSAASISAVSVLFSDSGFTGATATPV